jgi:MFS family permease
MIGTSDTSSDLARAGRHIVTVLFAVQSLSFAAVIAMATVFSIVAADLTGNPAWAGAPSALTSLSGGLAAPLLAASWDRWGRRLGLSLALALGVLGAGAAAASVELDSLWLFGLGILVLGATQSGARLSRFIAAEVTPAQSRGRAISLVVWGGTIGAVGGPLLVGPSSRLAAGLGWNELTGPIAVGVPLIALSVALSFAGLRPEPLELSRRLERQPVGQAQVGLPARALSQLLLQGSWSPWRRGALSDGDGDADGHHLAVHARSRPQSGRDLGGVRCPHLGDVRFLAAGRPCLRPGGLGRILAGRSHDRGGAGDPATRRPGLALGLFLLGLGGTSAS